MDKPHSKHRPWDRPKIKDPGPAIATRSRDEFYHTTRWKKESKDFRQRNPICAQCAREDLVVPSEVTDHIIPKNACSDPWDRSNWEALCKKCHAKKGSRDKKYFKK